MLISSKQLIGLRVETESGQHLGKVSSLAVEIDSHQIRHYHVHTSGIIHLFGKELLVHRDQVVSITKEKMTVENSVGKNIETEAARGKKSAPADSAACTG